MSELSIVIGTYNRLDQIRRCMESIFDQTTANFRIYVTDAGSTDGTVEYLRSIASDKVIPILVGQKLGQAKAYNDVFKIVETPYVCWLSDDNVIVNRGLDVAVSILEGDSRIGMVGLKTKDVRGPFVNHPYIGGVSTIGILNVNQGMLPTRVLKQVGGFSETFRDYGIDPDLTAKVLFSGYDIVYTREVTIHHYRNWDMDEGSLAHRDLEQKHERFGILYEEKFGRLGTRAPIWRVKCAAWSFITKAGPSIKNAGRSIAGRSIKTAWRSIAGPSIKNAWRLFKKTWWFKMRVSRFIRNAWRLFKKTWWFKMRVSRFIRKLINVQGLPNSTRRVFRPGARDWHNMFTGRYIRKLINVQGLPNSTRRVFRPRARDWHNRFTARYISPLDPLYCAGKPYHLRQHCPALLRPKVLPLDSFVLPSSDSRT